MEFACARAVLFYREPYDCPRTKKHSRRDEENVANRDADQHYTIYEIATLAIQYLGNCSLTNIQSMPVQFLLM